jgi:predicted RNA-binding Zn ribbon-like protein
MTQHGKSADDKQADALDVHVLDIAAHLEAILRGIRELQKHLLQIRGAVPGSSGEDPRTKARERLARMLHECEGLREAVETASDTIREWTP